MSENRLAPTLPDSRPIDQLVSRTRSLLRLSWVATGLGLTVGLGVATLLVVTLADLVVPLWPSFRLAAFILVAGPALWVLIQGVVLPAFRRLGPGYVARRIEAHLPGIHNRLVSCIDLARTQGTAAYSPAFYRRLVGEALERIRGFRPATVVDRLSLRRAGAFAGASVAAFLVALVLLSDRMPTALARIFLPLADIPPATGVIFTVTPGEDAKVLRGEDIAFAVAVEKGEANDFQLELFNPGADKPVWHALKKGDGNVWQLAVNSGNIKAGFEHSFRFRVHGGGTWTRPRQVTILDRPGIAALHTVLHFPDYMGMPGPHVGPPQVADVTGPEESRVEVVVQAEGDVTEGEIQLLKPRSRPVAPKDQVERVWFEDKLPAGAVAEGTWKWDAGTHQRPAHTEPAFAGMHGHWFQNAAVDFRVQPDDHLFAYVYLVPGHEPETLLLEWHDDAGWEHRAFWGADRVKAGQADSPSRWHVGPLPEAGHWVRLEVPAGKVDLADKSVRGMSFKLVGGQCYWSRTGAVRVREQALLPVKTFAMHAQEGNQWSGSFPLWGTGFYRVELRNELGYANKPMKEGKYVAIPDNPPQIVLERPGTDLVLSEPGKVPLVIAAFDDFGLADISLAVRRGEQGAWETRVLKKFAAPAQSDNLLTSLDLTPLKLKAGESIRYHAEARDRKGQVAKTQDFTIRIAADRNAADQQLAAFEKSQDPFHQKLSKLIAEQAKVREAVEKLAVKYATVDDKIKEAQAKPPEPEKDSRTGKPVPPPPKPPQLDPETERQLQELRKELAQLARQEQQNAALGKQIAADLAKTVEQAKKLAMMPRDIAEQMQGLQQLFQERALGSLQNLAQEMQQGANPRQNAPDVKQLNQESNRLQQELEALAQRLKALDDARKQMRDNVQDALAGLKQEMLRQKGELTARDLEELKKFIAALRQELEQQKGKQENLQDATGKAPDSDLPELERKQGEMDRQTADVLNRTRELQATDKMKRLKRQSSFPKAPYDPDTGEQLVRPKEEDPDAPAAAKKDKGDPAAADQKDQKAKGDDEEESKFMPALGGPKPKVDPRFANKMRPLPKKDGAKSAQDEREELKGRQDENLKDLNQANQSLASDEKSLEQMLRQLRQAMSSPEPNAQPAGQQQPGQQQGKPDLLQALRSQAMQQALEMAARMRGMRQSAARAQGRPNGQARTPTTGNLQGTPPPGAPLPGELDKLDPDTRAALLKLQPKLREDLLQSMREQGPEGYQEFINDYFKRLSKGKDSTR